MEKLQDSEEIRQILYQLSAVISKASLDLDEYFKFIKETLRFNLKVDDCQIIFDEKDCRFGKIIEFVRERKKPLTFNNLKDDWKLKLKKPFKKGSLIIMPLELDDSVLGIIYIYRKKEGFIKQYELEILKLVASQIVSVLGINTLHEKIVNQRDQLKSLVEELSTKLETIKMQKDRWQTVFDTADEGIIITDSKGIILNVNPSFSSLAGFKKKDIEGICICRAKNHLKPFSTVSICPVMESIEKRKKVDYEELWLEKKDGEPIWISVTASPIFDKSGKLLRVIEIIRNIDRQKKLEKEREDFITSVTHELRTPLTAVKGYLSMILNNRNIDAKSQLNYLKKAYKSSDEIVNLVEDLLEIIRIDDENHILDIRTIDCVKIINEAILGLEFKLKKADIKIKRKFQNKPLFVSSDYDKLKIIVSNVIDNAIKYSRKGIIEISLRKYKEQAEIKIRDTGAGISKQHIKNIFQKFYRADDIFTAKTPGVGLGLYIVNELAKKIGGEISVESKEGGGTTLTIRIPIVSQLQLLKIR